MRPIRRALAATAAVALCAFSTAATATVIDLKVTGTVATSDDESGIFGPAGGSLAGDAFLAEYLFDPSLGTRFTLPPALDDLSYNAGVGEVSPLLGASLTINGKTAQFNGASSNSYGVFALGDEFLISAFDAPTGSQTFNASFLATDGTSPATPGSITDPFSGDASNLPSGPDSYQVATETGGPLTVSTGTLNIEHIESLVSAAPEPMTWVMMIAGVAMIGLVLRRRSVAVAV